MLTASSQNLGLDDEFDDFFTYFQERKTKRPLSSDINETMTSRVLVSCFKDNIPE